MKEHRVHSRCDASVQLEVRIFECLNFFFVVCQQMSSKARIDDFIEITEGIHKMRTVLRRQILQGLVLNLFCVFDNSVGPITPCSFGTGLCIIRFPLPTFDRAEPENSFLVRDATRCFVCGEFSNFSTLQTFSRRDAHICKEYLLPRYI